MSKRMQRFAGYTAIILYVAVIMYFFFFKIKIFTAANFETAMAYELIGIMIFFHFVTKGLLSGEINSLCIHAIKIVTMFYIIAHNLFTIFFINIPGAFFSFIQFVCLLFFILCAIPMYYFGKKEL